MANKKRQSDNKDDELLMDDELTAAFLDEEPETDAKTDVESKEDEAAEWDEEEAVPGQLALDVYETKEKLIVKARTAGVSRDDLDVSISDNSLTIKGTLSAGSTEEVENYFVQECYWGEFSRSITLPVAVKEETAQAELKDGVLTMKFTKVKQDTVKKIKIT